MKTTWKERQKRKPVHEQTAQRKWSDRERKGIPTPRTHPELFPGYRSRSRASVA